MKEEKQNTTKKMEYPREASDFPYFINPHFLNITHIYS